MLDAASYRAIEKLRDGRSYLIRAQRRDDNIIDALHLRAGPRTFYLRFLTRKHRLNNFEAAFYLNVDFVRQVALLADLHGDIIGGARYITFGHRGRPTSPSSLATPIKTTASPQRC